ncbi:uncharacterized protein MONBRDRAFT_15015, partial [Monosiga brevicollis MX1]
DKLDKRFGFDRPTGTADKLGWLINMQPTSFRDTETGQVKSAVDFYFLEEDGQRFKATYPYSPYFLLRAGTEGEVDQYLKRKFDKHIAKIELVDKEDLDLDNHLIGLKQPYLKLTFNNVQDLQLTKSKISPIIKQNRSRQADEEHFAHAQALASSGTTEIDTVAKADERLKHVDDVMDSVLEMREYDVPYHMRVCIDNRIYVGKWYTVTIQGQQVHVSERADLLLMPDIKVLAWDIETTKLPLKFPNSEIDQIMMISYMIDNQGYLIINREIVSEDISDFEYTPKPEFPGHFEVFNCENEHATIARFFEHIQSEKPHVMVTYNGDSFDWPFLERRAEINDMRMFYEIGFRPNTQGEYLSRFAPHLDCFRWVKRDSYLPVGSHGLKAVTREKLRYDPLEIHYEEICRMAAEQPQELANYSVSDAVATYYLYKKYVQPFIFALCTIIALGPDDVLRKGSGTLCETLLMNNAYNSNIVMPNKKQADVSKMHNNHLLASETYIGGHVEALESGVFRSDIPCNFKVDPEAVQKLIDNLDAALHHAIVEEEKRDFDTIVNYDEVKAELVAQLEDLRDNPNRFEVPLIYHLDVAAMYPNIILTNRLQPPAVVDEKTCASCAFNNEENRCKRKMTWMWRGEVSPAGRSEYLQQRMQAESETFPGENPGDPQRPFHELHELEQAAIIKKRLDEYSRKTYKRTKDTIIEERVSTVCQRENPFYINTVRSFRDRRYEYKGKLKDSKRLLSDVQASGDPAEIKRVSDLVVLYDSLQLAHKCILNSFYGYVMRKGARWFSMEMAGVVCLTGANIITKAREIVERLGRPLELDTDGIWCCLPGSFPEEFTFKTSDPGKKAKITISYPGAMLNIMVNQEFTNDQYQDLVDERNLIFKTKVENSIFFEVDGPYKAMILPASKEKDKRLKKRYAVFNEDGSLAELKGFEIKRNGELKIIKIFQKEVFDSFLLGNSLEEVYAHVADVANHWLDILYTHGEGLPDYELFDLISENRSMSRTLADYGTQKSTSISTAKRLAQFLGDEMVKDKGLACQFIISKKPEGTPVTERAIPVTIFQAEEQVKRHYLRLWTKEGAGLESADIRDILDWDYYIERLGSAIQKIITIPAAMQKVENPVPRVQHPDWLQKRLLDKNDIYKQRSIRSYFSAAPVEEAQGTLEAETENLKPTAADIEDQFRMSENPKPKGPMITVTRRKKLRNKMVSVNEQVQAGDWREVMAEETSGDPAEDYPAWLKYQKRKWSIQRAERKRKRSLGISMTTAVASGDSVALSRYVAGKQEAAIVNHWQIIQIANTSTPGIFKLWCLVDGGLHAMRLNVPRRFYVNMHEEDPTKKHIKVSRQLPRSHPCKFLYQFEMTETQYLRDQKRLASQLSHSDVEGVYELQMPLLWRALLELSCTTGIRREAIKARAGAKGEFGLTDLAAKPESARHYLADRSAFHDVFFYHWYVARWILRRCFLKRISAFVQSQSPLNCMLSSTPKRLKQVLLISPTMSKPIGPVLATVRTEQEAHNVINEELLRYHGAKHGPTVVLLNSSASLSQMSSHIDMIKEFPVVVQPFNASDNMWQFHDWRRSTVQTALHRYAKCHEIFQDRIEIARYAQAPVGNIPSDFQPFIHDLFFARQLQQHNFVLWMSPSTRPDLGGKAQDDNRLMLDDEQDAYAMNQPGFYDTCCVELEVMHLPICAVLQYATLSDEGSLGITSNFDTVTDTSLHDMMTGASAALTSFDETAQCFPAFRVLKSLVGAWLNEVASRYEVMADGQLQHFYRWLKNPMSMLYDPALLRTVRDLMKKLFLHLITHVKRLGNELVYASFNRMILKTAKSDVPQAKAHIDYVLSVLSQNNLFAVLTLAPQRAWSQLLWMDAMNFGGIDAQSETRPVLEDDEDGAPSERDGVDTALSDDEGGMSVVRNFNIQQYLPVDRVQHLFALTISMFLYLTYEARQNDLHRRSSAREQRLREAELMTASQIRAEVADQNKDVTSETKRCEAKPRDAQPGHQSRHFPHLAGSHLPLQNPALEFIKYTCHLLSMDKAHKGDYERLKRDLLRMINKREFAAESAFRNPCMSLTLPQFVCAHCNLYDDLNLCDDEVVTKRSDGASNWVCLRCQHQHNREEIEQQLLSVARQALMAYQLQDLRCLKCKLIKGDHLSRHCSCAGAYALTEPSERLQTKLHTLFNVAKYHQLKFLQEELEWNLRGMGVAV